MGRDAHREAVDEVPVVAGRHAHQEHGEAHLLGVRLRLRVRVRVRGWVRVRVRARVRLGLGLG